MKVEYFSPIRSLRGKSKCGDVAFSMFGKQPIMRSSGKKTCKPPSPDQIAVRTFLAEATANWDELTAAQRHTWEQYARNYFSQNSERANVVPSGIATYVRANHCRQILGLPLLTEASLLPPPPPINFVMQATASSADMICLDLYHSLADPSGHAVLVRATPPMPTRARKPPIGALRYVRSFGPDSSAPLPATGGAVTFAPVRFPIQDGQRYGVEVRVVRMADGLMSPPAYGDFDKSS